MLPQWFTSMGVLAWPLLLCSLVVLILAVERLVLFARLSACSKAQEHQLLSQCQNARFAEVRLPQQGWGRAVALLLAHRGLAQAQREELLACWLEHERQRQHQHLRLLQLLGVLAPMLGLLGTVLGMLDMFADIAGSDKPVTPALLADGLWQALYTTAWGMLIALPALAVGQGFNLWSNQYIERLQGLLNRCQLALQGLSLDAQPAPLTPAKPQREPQPERATLPSQVVNA
ncbi:MotA/TolQ/ExbB proton channel family protein [Atopomonas sediminilitoris]|uniref:MotA/TolQ/ExbB proton channel family protein n=1 Tax=Atopomonas sediminilitoris TaxID=2919919 RepID=UPI001F4E1AAF|nr:MotA/TolQ/ExbB proton channel family protein [Atopomonas sediminilitoris]MCJ8168111.1 MotA/TolQ/ExbB proton channel family protein [Atopomonas sediminilitoris]